ncbi:MAG: tRNA lysidine(34) synthetase TilS [Sphingomonadales bacterium]|nr:MAG: tRNA lysidine(34) synthetase TilS [Sphingomonadales bacterium]
MTLDPQAVERFRGDVLALVDQPTRIALAVSGGPDSMAMLALAHAAFPGAVIAATVDHRLRAGAADEAATVKAVCAEIGVPHATLQPKTPIAGASIQAQAREARYALLADWARGQGAAVLLTAHHADDQAETFLMRAVRGSGVPGLAGIRARRALPGLAILRPLLRWRRAELHAVAQASGWPLADDPSNRDTAHDRTRFRLLLAAEALLDPAGLARAADYAADAESALSVLADRFWQERAQASDAEVMIDLSGLPRDTRRRLARRAIAHVRDAANVTAPAFTSDANIEALLDILERDSSGTHAAVQASSRANHARFRLAPPRRSH